jgi:hypothetical protein
VYTPLGVGVKIRCPPAVPANDNKNRKWYLQR